ncbi:MAG: DEAD/DEAH box helicase, partial [Pseudomonadales bacterium]|nr:DEAD/DEAH box helicase [Pseudomonadales bacterium]
MPVQMLINPPIIDKGQQQWCGLTDAATALTIAETSHNHPGLCLVITSDTSSAEQLRNELAFFCDENLSLLTFPDWETLPYDSFSPHRDIVSERLKTLYRLPNTNKGILVVPAPTLMQRIAPKEFIIRNSLLLEAGQKFDLQSMRANLVGNGYRQVDTVYEHGEFAVRGAIIDIFPMGSGNPYRIDLFDDEIDQLRTFDPETQRTIAQIDQISVLPAHEYPFDKTAIQLFRQNWRSHFEIDPQACHIYQDVSAGLNSPGIEYYLPLFFPECANLLDYLPKSTLVLSLGAIDQALSEQWHQITQRYEERRFDPERPLLPPLSLFLPDNEVFGALKAFNRIKLTDGAGSQPAQRFNSSPAPRFVLDHHAENPLAEVKNYIDQSPAKILFCAESAGRKESLLTMLRKIGLSPTDQPNWQSFLNSPATLSITIANLDRGLALPDSGIVIITESQLFGQQVMQRRRRSQSKDYQDQLIKNLAELRVDSPVVHIDHGVGRYRGLETILVNGQAEEFLTLEYAGGAKLYVPIASLHLIARYTGNDEATAPLHTLGSDKWQKAKRKAAEQARDTAAELLEIHARRAAKAGIAFRIPEKEYQQFCADFPFEETEDQMSAIEATLNDMRSARPMDRLICGDVGFGKTEVAMRAAFIAAQNGAQVAILVPTTLLAQQHFDSFSDRFANWPINIAVISRFQTRDEQERIQAQVKNGQVDILIATHKLIVGHFTFKNLGLLVIDEEHRFGVRQKDKIKSLRSDVDILALTATPIPRTLNMAIAGIRDISIIVSPPAKRLSINTFIHRQENGVRREAINRELLRGGQV